MLFFDPKLSTILRIDDDSEQSMRPRCGEPYYSGQSTGFEAAITAAVASVSLVSSSGILADDSPTPVPFEDSIV